MMNSERLAHELILNPSFQLDPNGRWDSIHASFHEPFWDSLPQGLQSNPPNYDRLLRFLREINETVHKFAIRAEPPAYVGVIAQGTNALADLAETNAVPAVVVNINALLLQLIDGSFGWDDCRALVGGFVETIRARQEPARDAELTTQWAEVSLAMDSATPEEQPAALCKAFRFLMDRVSLMP